MNWKCLFLGHKWKNIGFRRMKIYADLNDPSTFIVAYDNLLYCCRRCGKNKEKHLTMTYDYIDIDQQSEVNIEE